MTNIALLIITISTGVGMFIYLAQPKKIDPLGRQTIIFSCIFIDVLMITLLFLFKS